MTTSGASYLPPDDPHHPRWAAAVQLESDPRVRQMSAVLVASCPREDRSDPARCAEYLGGASAASVIGTALSHAEKDATVHVARADEAKDELIRATKDLEAINADRARLPDTPTDGPHGRRLTPAQNRVQMVQTERIAAQRELAGDDEHTRIAHTPPSGHVVAVVAAVIETVFTLRVFNVSLTHVTWTAFLPWLAATVALAVFNVKVGEWVGRQRRTAREIERMHVDLNTLALAEAYARGARVNALPSGDPPATTGSPAGLAPSAAQVHAAKRDRTTALVVWGLPVALVLTGLYWRLAVGALPLDLGPVTWILPAAIAAVIAALLWASIVDPNSRGNALGDDLRAAQAVDAAVVAKDEGLVRQGLQLVEHGELNAETVDTELLEAAERVTEAAEMGVRALQIASAALGVVDVPEIRSRNMIAPTMPHVERVRTRAHTELAALRELAVHLGIQHMPALDPLPSSFVVLGERAGIPPETALLGPPSLPGFPGSTFGQVPTDAPDSTRRTRPGRRVLLAALLAVAVLAAALTWLVVDHGRLPFVTATSAAAVSSDPAGSGTSSPVANPAPAPRAA